MKIIIPARRGSQGFPFKNRKLFDETARTIMQSPYNVIVSSNDEVIKIKTDSYGFVFHKRSEDGASHTATPKQFMQEIINDCKIPDDEIIICLYLTYPERNTSDISNAWKFFSEGNADSMLCSKKALTSPYLMIYEDGKQVIEHNLCRRQDYKKCFEISHFVCIFRAGELSNLNNNLYNEKTAFMPIRNVVDVDTERDYIQYDILRGH